MNKNYRKPLQDTQLEYYDVRQAVEDIQPGAYAKLPYTSKVLAEQLVRRCDPAILEQSLKELINRKQDHDFPWYPARVVCHDILGNSSSGAGNWPLTVMRLRALPVTLTGPSSMVS